MGFGYKEWSGVFYPDAMQPGDYLGFYSKYFDTVELDTTFHAIPAPGIVQRWREVVPEDFRFCPRIPRQITHDEHPEQRADVLREFIGTIRELEEKLAIVLMQFPPSFTASHFDPLQKLFDLLPKDLRFAVEFRDASWQNDRTEALLRERRIAWVSADHMERAAPPRTTADFLYVRWVGVHGSFPNMNAEMIDVQDRLEHWAKALSTTAGEAGEIWGFFNNDYAGYSIGSCNRMKRIVGMEPRTSPAEEQGELFERKT